MIQLNNLSIKTDTVIVNRNEAMDSDIISKHGRSSKSHTIRCIFLKNKKNLLFVFSASIIFFSCSSPSSDGKKAGKMMCDCNKEYPETKYRGPNQPMYEMGYLGDPPHNTYEGCRKKADNYYKKVREKYYNKGGKKLDEFSKAYNQEICERSIIWKYNFKFSK